MGYRFEATSVAGFVQQLAVQYVLHGYFFYVTGEVPEGKDPRAVDQKLMRLYEVDLSRWAKARRKRAGLANVHYLRFDRIFVLVATGGTHPFFEREGESVRDIRRDSLTFMGYSIGYKRGRDGRFHASVRMHPQQYLMLRDYFVDRACHASAERLERELRSLPFEPYAPVQVQLLSILRKLNRKRHEAGLEPVSRQALRLRRRQLKPFADAGEGAQVA